MKIQILKPLLLLVLVSGSVALMAQKKSFFDYNWKKCKEKSAAYYRIITPEGNQFLVKDYFYTNSQIRMEGHYTSKKMEYNTKQGVFTYYFSNGQKKSEGEYKNGKAEGKWTRWYFDGTVRWEGEYEKDEEQGVWEYFHKNGKLRTKPTYKDGEKDGPSVFYYDNGDKEEEIIHSKGKKDGEFKDYYKGDKLKIKGKFVKDSLEGTYEYYWESGKLAIKGEYSDNKKHGVWQYFHSNGNKSCETEYKKGKFVKASFFDEEGQKLSKKVYEEDMVKEAEFTGGKDEMYKIIRKQVEKKVDLVAAKKGKVYFIGLCKLSIDEEGNIIDRDWDIPEDIEDEDYDDPYTFVKNLNAAIDDFPKLQPAKAYNRYWHDTYYVWYILSYKNISIN